MKFSMTEQVKRDLSIQRLLNRGDLIDRFDCIYTTYLSKILFPNIKLILHFILQLFNLFLKKKDINNKGLRRVNHDDKGKLNKCILKTTVDTEFCLTQSCVGNNNLLHQLYFEHLSNCFTISSVKYAFQIQEIFLLSEIKLKFLF